MMTKGADQACTLRTAQSQTTPQESVFNIGAYALHHKGGANLSGVAGFYDGTAKITKRVVLPHGAAATTQPIGPRPYLAASPQVEASGL